MYRSTVVLVVAISMCFAFSAQAEKGDPGVLVSAIADGSSPGTTIGRSTPDSQVVVNIDTFASWDALDDPSNDTLIVPLGAGAIMTGIGWDVGITTVGGSYLSEARMYFDGQDLDGTGLFLTPGVADANSGTGTYSSGGILDLTDNGVTGGTQNLLGLAMIWTPIDHARFSINYDHIEYDGAAIPAGPDTSYGVDVFGARAEVDF